jgi:hypothetical protein
MYHVWHKLVHKRLRPACVTGTIPEVPFSPKTDSHILPCQRSQPGLLNAISRLVLISDIGTLMAFVPIDLHNTGIYCWVILEVFDGGI